MMKLLALVLALAVFQEDPKDRKVSAQVDLRSTCDAIHELMVHGKTGNILAFGEKGYSAVFYPREETERKLPFSGKTDLLAACLSADDRMLFLAGRNGLVHVLDAKDMKTARTWPDDELFADGPLLAVAASQDGRLLASGGTGKVVHLYDLEARKELPGPKKAADAVTALAFSDDSKSLAFGTQAGSIHLMDPRAPEGVREVKAHAGAVTGLVYDAAGGLLYSASTDGSIKVFEVASGAEKRQAKPLDGPIRKIRLAGPESPSLLAAAASGRLAILNAGDLSLIRELPGERAELTSAAMDPQGRFVAVAYRGGQIRRYFLPKSLAAPADNAPGAEYEGPGALAGLVLEPDESGGCRIVRVLLGFMAPKGGPEAGNVITHVEQNGEFKPLNSPAGFSPAPGETKVRFKVRNGEEKEGVLLALSRDEVRKKAEFVKALLQDELPPEFGLQFDLPTGQIFRVDPEGPSARQISEGSYLKAVNGKPWGPEAVAELMKKQPVDVEFLSGIPGVQKVRLTPAKPPAFHRDVQLAFIYQRAGDKAKAKEHGKAAEKGGETSWRLWVEIAKGERETGRAGSARKALEMGLKKAAYQAPLVELLAQLTLEKEGAEAALALLDEHKSPDLQIEFLRHHLLSQAGKRPQAIEGLRALARRGVWRAHLELAQTLASDGQGDAALESYRRYFYQNGPAVDDQGKPAAPKYGSADSAEFRQYLDLIQKLGR